MMFTASNASCNNKMLCCPPNPLAMERMWKPAVEIAPNCPRCASTNTKFCYYNNYSLSQPRYFCKGCRRYWTKGGSLRNVPVGGGCRKSRRAKSAARLQQQQNRSSNVSSSSSSSSSEKSESSSSEGATESGEIDIAAVFAKFLHQSSTVEVSNSSKQESLQDDVMVQCQNPCDTNNIVVESELFAGLPEVIEGNEMNAFELQSLLGDEMVSQDDLWCENPTMPDFMSTWQQQSDEQLGDQLNVSGNSMVNGNWDPLDLTSFELFSRSYM